MNPNLANSTSQENDPAAHSGQPGIITYLSLPNSIQASRFQLSRLRAPLSAIAAPPPYFSAVPPPYVSAVPPPYINAASQLIVNGPLAFTNAPQLPPDYSTLAASQAQSTAANKNSMSSSVESNQHALSREQAYVLRPAFSLADSHEGGHKLQHVNVPQTTSNDSHQFAPVISNMQTWSPDDFSTNSMSVSGPKVVSTQEPQICIGSVFSLVDSHIEHHTGQHETENEAGHIAIDNSASQQTVLEWPALPHVHHQNTTISAMKEQDTVLSQVHTTLTTKRNQYPALCSALNRPVHLMLPLGNINNIHQITNSKNSVSVEVSSPKDDSQLLLGCGASIPTSVAHQLSISAVASIKDAQLPVSQKNGSITETEKKTTDVLRGEETHEKPASLTKPQDSSSTSQVLTNASKVQEPKLDIEYIDDCMLVKIDLNKHHLSYDSKIHNSEVVIDDSDNDEDVTKETSDSFGETSSGKCDKPKSSTSFTVVMGENDPCRTTGFFSMEVEEINTDTSKTNREQTAATYTMSSTGQTHVTSVMSTRTIAQPLSDQIYSEDSCSTWSAPEIENLESKVMDLHVDDDDECDDAPLSPVIQLMSSSSLLSSTSDIPALMESYRNSFFKSAVQSQVIENMLRRSEIPLFPSHEDVKKGQVSQMIDSSKVPPTVPRHESHHLQLDSAAGEITNYKCSRKPSLKGKAVKSTTPRPKGTSAKNLTLKIKIPSAVRTQKKSPSYSDIKSSSAAVTASRNVFCDISSTDRSLTCKFCGAEFISENELTHHTEQKCRKLQNTKAIPQLKNLSIVLSRVSVMCQMCHLPFADDIKLAEHLHLNQPCQKGTSETVKRVLELRKSHLDIDALKRDGKRRSCEIVTGISNVTRTISMASSKDGCIALAEQMPAMDNVINEKLSKGNNGHISSNSSAKQQCVCDKGNAINESNGHADDYDTDEMSSSDEGSDMEESGSSSEEGNRDYTCKQCCKTYTSKSLLIQHNKSHHHSAHSKKTHCKVCTRKFHDLTGLQAHLLQFKFCFIPLTRPLWERKQDSQICSMCKKVLSSPKDLRKHCFKKMACRLRYINTVLKNTKEKDNASVLPAAEAEIPVLKTVKEKDIDKVIPASDAVLAVSNIGKENCESQSANEVSSSVQDYCNPVVVDSSSSDVDIEDEISCIKISHVVSKPLIKCLNCSGFFYDFQEHLLKQQSCLDFFGIHANKCPIPVPFCYQCKTHFDDISLLQLHACKGFVAYTHVCQTCGLKFTSAHNLHAHVQQSLTCNKTNLSSPQKNNRDSDHTFVESSVKNHQSGMFASSSAVRDVSTSSGEQLFHCLICDARFATLRLLMEHSHQHVEETPICCDKCSITFLHYNEFVSHQAFHIRMDKEANNLVERPQLSTLGASTSTDKNMKANVGSTNTDKYTRAQNSETMTNNGSTCIFCHQEFGSVEAKLAHLNSDHACLAIMRYIIENRLFIHDQGGTEPFDRRVRDLNCCEFCNQSFSDTCYHYLNSACLGRLESAIQKYRSSPHPTQRQEIDSAVSQTEHKETDTHRVIMKHQGEQQLSGEASASRDPTSSTGGFPEETCCLNCGQCFWTMIEVKEHLSLWGHKHLLPRSVMESADWLMPRCKVCNLKYAQRHTLFNHMVRKHSNKVSVLFRELGYTSCCSLCNQTVMSSSMQHHFQQHKMKFVEEIKGKSQLPLWPHSVELCIVCNREYSSRKDLLEHVQQHTHADIFTSKASKASPALNSRKRSMGSSPKHEEDQRLGSSVENVASSNKVGSCKLCGKQFAQINYHYLHFKRCHKEYDRHSWKQWFIPLVDLKQGSPPTKTITSSKKPRAAFQKYKCKLCHRAFSHVNNFMNHISLSHEDIDPEKLDEFLEECKVTELLNVKAMLKSRGTPQFSKTGFSSKTVKSQQKIVSCKVCNKQFSKLRFFKCHFKQAHRNYNVANWEDVFNVIGTAHPDSTNTSDVQNDSLPSDSKKTALLQPLGSCNLCHKKFTNFSFFQFHLKESHSRFDPEDHLFFFKAFTPSHHGEDLKNCHSEDSASLPLGSCKLCHKIFTNFSFFKFHLMKSHSRFAPGDQKHLFKAFTPSCHEKT